MNLLFLSSDKFPPYRVDVSELLAKEMVRLGHHFDFVLQSDEPCKKAYEADWSGCHVLVGAMIKGNSFFTKLQNSFLDFCNDFKIAILMQNKSYDCVIVKDKFLSALLAALFAKAFNRPFLYWLSFPFPEENLLRGKAWKERLALLYLIRGYVYKLLLFRIIIPSATHIFVQSEQMRKDLAACGAPREKMTPVPMGVSKELINLANQNLARSKFQGHPMVVYLGALNASRKMEFVIKSFNSVLKSLPGAKLYMIGSSNRATDVEILKREAENLGISSSIVFTGFLPRLEALVYVQNADVCLSPIAPDPIFNPASPTKIIEYMSLGKAVVANNHPEQEKIINSSRSGICVPWKEREFADAICYLLKNPEEASEMGRRGKDYVMTHRIYSKIAEKVVQKMEEIIYHNSK